MGTILPLHSPALSGGGVNENYFKDMMKDMQGVPGTESMQSMLGGLGGGPSADPSAPKKKDKKKK